MPATRPTCRKIGKAYIAGLLAHIKEIALVTNQWVNSYKRLVPGYEAPVYICWSRRNRSAMVRVPLYKPGKENATRVELRNPDPACNPYLAFAAMLAAGLDGIEKGMKLSAGSQQQHLRDDRSRARRRRHRLAAGRPLQAIKAFERSDLRARSPRRSRLRLIWCGTSGRSGTTTRRSSLPTRSRATFPSSRQRHPARRPKGRRASLCYCLLPRDGPRVRSGCAQRPARLLPRTRGPSRIDRLPHNDAPSAFGLGTGAFGLGTGSVRWTPHLQPSLAMSPHCNALASNSPRHVPIITPLHPSTPPAGRGGLAGRAAPSSVC